MFDLANAANYLSAICRNGVCFHEGAG